MICPIQLASRLSGLSTHVIRIWERRYGALSPTRTDTNRRMYCEEAIKRLNLLRELTENGHRIGGVAKLPDGRFDSGLIETNKSFSFTFSEAGTFPYFCTLHPATMRGEVRVG